MSEPTPAAPLLGPEAREVVAKVVEHFWYEYEIPPPPDDVLAALEPLVAALLAEQERAVRERIAAEVDAMVDWQASQPKETDADRWDSQLVQIALETAARKIRERAS